MVQSLKGLGHLTSAGKYCPGVGRNCTGDKADGNRTRTLFLARDFKFLAVHLVLAARYRINV